MLADFYPKAVLRVLRADDKTDYALLMKEVSGVILDFCIETCWMREGEDSLASWLGALSMLRVIRVLIQFLDEERIHHDNVTNEAAMNDRLPEFIEYLLEVCQTHHVLFDAVAFLIDQVQLGRVPLAEVNPELPPSAPGVPTPMERQPPDYARHFGLHSRIHGFAIHNMAKEMFLHRNQAKLRDEIVQILAGGDALNNDTKFRRLVIWDSLLVERHQLEDLADPGISTYTVYGEFRQNENKVLFSSFRAYGVFRTPLLGEVLGVQSNAYHYDEQGNLVRNPDVPRRVDPALASKARPNHETRSPVASGTIRSPY